VKTSKVAIGIFVAVLVGVVMGALGAWAVGLAGGTEVQILEGYASVNEEGTAIGLSPNGQVPGPGYVVAGAMWREQDGSWHDTFPTCLEPLASDQRVRLGVVDVRRQGQAPGRPVVVWLECLD
jgi:hypothetical protein